MPFLKLLVSTVSATAGQYSGVRRVLRAVRIAVRDERIPNWIRVLAGVGLLPIPGPLDELALLLAAVPLGLFYRCHLAEAWREAATPPR
jgi:hypothetical protein